MSTRLRTATGQGVTSLWARIDRLSRRVSARAMDLAWHRPSPVVVLIDRRFRHDVRVAASLRLVRNDTLVARPGPEGALTVSMQARPPAAAPRLETVVERHHLETRIVEGRPRAVPPASGATPRGPTAVDAALASPPAKFPPAPTLTTRRESPAPRAEMILSRAPQAAAGTAPASAAPEGVRGVRAPAPLTVSPAPAGPPELRIERIATEVVRALDARLLAFRERMGHR